MKFIFFYTTLLFFAFSCKKNDHPCADVTPESYHLAISPDLNTYKFKKDSYWIYLNDSTAEIDSQRVVSTLDTQIGSGGGSSCLSAYAAQYFIYMESSFNSQSFCYYLMGNHLTKQTFVPGKSETPIFSTNVSSTLTDGMQLLETIPSMDVNGNNFQHVKKVRVDFPARDIVYYFDDAVGIIKWEVLSGLTVTESWSIKSWEILL